jgi:uncharacterized protein (DUF488 family)
VTAKQLFTLGYEGADLQGFLRTLSENGITQLIDVREVPISRKRGFSKSALRDALANRGILYLHLKDLGDPKPGREAARRGDFSEFQRIYAKHLETEDAKAALAMAAARASARTSCLLCFERDNANCHRSVVARHLASERGFSVRHIGVRSSTSVAHKTGHGQGDHYLSLG